VRRSNRSLGFEGVVEGILVIDKPTGISSYDVIRAVRRRLSPQKVGHTGTLDPLASGVLPVALNGATKVIPFLEERIKKYEGTLRLGIVTDSDDSTGRVLRETRVDETALTRDRILSAMGRFIGKIRQLPPMFSAAKHRGRPLYEWARRGIEVERRVREVEIFSLEVTRIKLPLIDFRVCCSRGTYVRVLSRQIGETLGAGGHLCRLRRTASGPFHLGQAVPLPELDGLIERGEIHERIITPREALGTMPEIEIGGDLDSRIKNGRQVLAKDLKGLTIPSLERNQRVKILHQGEMVAIALAQICDRDPGGEISEAPALSLLRVFG
jgi:tRNA pseudouridine55 synthase